MDAINTASIIGSKLCRNAIWADGRCTWMSPTDTYITPGQAQREYLPLDYDLYAGCAGVGAFLSSLYKVTGDDIFKLHAEGALRNSMALLKKSRHASQGFFTGKAGVAAMLIKVGMELSSEEFIDGSAEILKTLTIPDNNTLTDVISGAAGTILGLAHLKTDLNVEINDNYLKELGSFLLMSAKTENNGISWKTAVNQKHNLTGFAHGAAGIATALLKLYELYGNNDFLRGALDGVAYENALFSPQQQNWPDLRNISDEDFYRGKFNYNNAWCHGAPGIGLSRLNFYKILGSDEFLNDIKAAADTTVSGLNNLPNYSLCHGIAGNICFLMEANKILKNASISSLVKNTCNNLHDEYLQHHLPLPSGLNDMSETPGLMLGLAGTGYFLLKCEDLLKEKQSLHLV